MKRIYMTSEQFNYLTNICKSNTLEISGTIVSKNYNDGICLEDVVFDKEDEIEEQNEKSISINPRKFVYKLYCALNENKGDYIIHFHTHPNSNITSAPSNTDKKFIESYQKILDKTIVTCNERKLLNRELGAKYVECIIHKDTISFWYYNSLNKKIEEIRFYIDNKLVVYLRNKSIFKLISDSFKEGAEERRNERRR